MKKNQTCMAAAQTAVVALLATVGGSNALGQNLIVNPGFELPGLDTAPGFMYLNGANATFMPGWTVATDGVNEASYVYRRPNYAAFVYNGDHSLELSDGDTLTAQITTTAGVVYVWSFAALGNDGGGQRLSAGDLDAVFFPARDGVGTGVFVGAAEWKRPAVLFTAQGTTTTLTISDTPQGNLYGGINLDDMRVVPCVDVLRQPDGQTTGLIGGPFFRIAAAGAGPLTYQWQVETGPETWVSIGTDPVPLACGGSISATNPVGSQTNISVHACEGVFSYRVRCVVSSTCGAISSDPATYRICPADLDDGSGTGTPDGGVTIADFLYFLDLYAAGAVRADFDDGSGNGHPDGGVTIEDFLYYITRFRLGC